MKQIDAVAEIDRGGKRAAQRKPEAEWSSENRARTSIRRILVPVDFSLVSLHALDYAVAQAREFGAEIVLLHVLDPILVQREFTTPRMRALKAEARRGIRKRLAALEDRRVPAAVKVRCSILEGKPSTVINEAAEKARCDLIVMGSVGRSGFGRFFLGSVAETVVRQAVRPVTIVPPVGRKNKPTTRAGVSGTGGQKRGAAIVLIGPPGSGKTTIARELAMHRPMPVIEVGSLLRLEIERATPIGKVIEPFIAVGELVPFEIVEEVVSSALKIVQDDVVLFDGIPRATNQIIPFLELLVDHGFDLFAVLIVTIDMKTAVERLSGRRICSQCRRLYNIAGAPSHSNKKCEACGGQLIQRHDDQEAVVKARFKRYERELVPVIEFFKKELGRMTIEIGGTGGKARRLEGIWRHLERLVPQIA